MDQLECRIESGSNWRHCAGWWIFSNLDNSAHVCRGGVGYLSVFPSAGRKCCMRQTMDRMIWIGTS